MIWISASGAPADVQRRERQLPGLIDATGVEVGLAQRRGEVALRAAPRNPSVTAAQRSASGAAGVTQPSVPSGCEAPAVAWMRMLAFSAAIASGVEAVDRA